jgi:hypothetical protein
MRNIRPSRWMQGVLCAALLALLCGCGQATAPAATKRPETPATRGAETPAASSVERYDLKRDEELGGHTLKKHIGRTDHQLEERLYHERNISAASTWTDLDAAEATVAAALRAERDRVQSWMRRGYPRANLALHFDAGHAIGRSLRRGDTQIVNCTGAVIVLRADGRDSFFVLTTYPEGRE